MIELTATDGMANTTVLAMAITVTNIEEIAQKIDEIRDELAGDLRNHAMQSLGDMLSFNEGLMSSDSGDFCSAAASDGLSGTIDADETQQSGQFNWSKRMENCESNYRILLDAGTSISRLEGNWTTRGLGSVRIERRFSSELLLGLGLMGSYADDKLPSFADSSINDKSLQVNGYLKARLLSNLRVGAFAGVGRSWYDFELSDGGLDLSGEATGDRTAFGGVLSGDIPLGDLLITTDFALSHARENLGDAELKARFAGESRDGIAFPLGSVDTTRLSVPVKFQYAFWDSEAIDGKSTRLFVSPGLLCEDHSIDSSALECGYQLGMKVETRATDRNFLYLDYRFESVDDMRRNLFGAGVSHRFGSERQIEMSLEGNRATVWGGEEDYRSMLRLKFNR